MSEYDYVPVVVINHFCASSKRLRYFLKSWNLQHCHVRFIREAVNERTYIGGILVNDAHPSRTKWMMWSRVGERHWPPKHELAVIDLLMKHLKMLIGETNLGALSFRSTVCWMNWTCRYINSDCKLELLKEIKQSHEDTSIKLTFIPPYHETVLLKG